MKNVKWLIEDFEQDNSFGELAEEIRRQGMECKVVPYDAGNSLPNTWEGEQCVLFQGSISLACWIQRNRDWIPGAFANWRHYCCSVYYAYYGKYLLNSEYVLLPFSEFQRRFDEFIDRYDGEFFLRPDNGSKSFSGMKITREFLGSNMERYVQNECYATALVVVAPKKNIHREWRLVCTATEVVTGSRYRTWGQPDFNSEVPQEVLDKGLEILNSNNSWVPDNLFIMDICDCPGEGLKLLEIGAFSVAGLYKCDLVKIVERASDVAWKEYSLFQK